jgi:hypothetical protein
VSSGIDRDLGCNSVGANGSKLAGEAVARVAGATAIDAIVMASAAARGDTVFTSDVDDLERLRAFFPNVRVLWA